MALLRALVYTAGLGGVGYALMNIVTPDETKLAKVLPEGQPQYYSENQRKKQAFVDILKGAAEGREPMYRQSREEIDAQREKFINKKST